VAVQAFVNLHSGEYAVYVPWDSKKSLAPNLPKDINDVLERIDSYCQCMHGAAGAVAGYASEPLHSQSNLPSMICPGTARRAWRLICPRTSTNKVGRLCLCAVKVQEGSAYLLDNKICRGGGLNSHLLSLEGSDPCRYLAFGSSMDYMYEELHVQYPLTIEVHPDPYSLPKVFKCQVIR